jgi:hypothetical protein
MNYIDQFCQTIDAAGISAADADLTRTVAHADDVLSNYQRYEADKAMWSSQHPHATPSEYEHAMREIARVHGV